MSRGSRIRVKVDTKRIRPKISKASDAAVGIVTQQVVKDGNLYAPQDTGELHRSGIRHSDFKNGKAIWSTPYAKRLYYGTHFKFSKDKNPRAQALWVEKAKSVHRGKWAQVAQKAVKRKI